MSAIGGLTGVGPSIGKPGVSGATLFPGAATTPRSVRPDTPHPVTPATSGQALRPAADDAAVDAARREFLAAARRAVMRAALAQTSKMQPPEEGEAPPRAQAASNPMISELLARVTAKAALPVLPEPATPARAAFAEAIMALRSGIKLGGTAEALAGRA